MFGRDQTRNPVSPEKGAATFWKVEQKDDKGRVIEPARNMKWTARLGAISYGDPVIANGRTATAAPTRPRIRLAA
jgi:hypothetical protein